jgi:hypothetical protein
LRSCSPLDRAIQAARDALINLQTHQMKHGGWPLYHGGELDISYTVKA